MTEAEVIATLRKQLRDALIDRDRWEQECAKLQEEACDNMHDRVVDGCPYCLGGN